VQWLTPSVTFVRYWIVRQDCIRAWERQWKWFHKSRDWPFTQAA